MNANPSQPPSELREALRALRPYFVRAAGFSFIAAVLVLAPNLYMLEVYNRVVYSGNHKTLLMLTLAVMLAYAVMELLEWTHSVLMHEAGVEFERKLRNRVFDAMFAAGLRGASTPQPMNDLRTIRDSFASPVLSSIMQSPASLIFLLVLLGTNPVLGWASLAGAVVQVGLGLLNERATQPPLVKANKASIVAQQYADGTLRNAQVIESMGMLKDIHRRWVGKQQEFLRLQALASERAGGYQALMRLVQNVISSGLLGLGAWLLLQNRLTGGAGMMIVGSILGGRVLAPLIQIVAGWRSAINYRDARDRLDTFLKGVPARVDAMPLPAPRGILRVEQVMAGAPGSPTAIVRGVQFALVPGEVLAVIGPSASGKTTLARLLTGLWPTMSGKVRLDGVDVYTWDKNELGPHVGYLPQGIELFDGTIAENIARFGEPEPAKVEAAARAVGLHDLIMQLPDGYDSLVGREGAILSGGQRQRVGLARAIYGSPAFVVLDEPNSSLDEAGDAALAAAILALKAQGTTFVVMTHRTAIFPVVDKVLLMMDGQMQAFGPRDEVMAAMAKAAQQAQQQRAAQLPAAVAAA